MAAPVSQLLARTDIWLGRQWQQDNPGTGSGYAPLDDLLAGKGWPQVGVVELIGDCTGLGDLLLPVLKAQQSSDRWQLCLAPPGQPYAPAWADAGIALERLVWVDAECRKEQLWTLEQALNSGRCSLILAWLEKLSGSEARRLQLAAQKGGCLLFLHLPESVLAEHHAVALRLGVVASQSGCTLRLIKQRGGWPAPDLPLPLPHRPVPHAPATHRFQQGGPAAEVTMPEAGVVQGPW
ncbi:translesion DNA synthesis-associated protein ImuA [Ferrimonas marina]|uniref:Cell division inhibitor SulA n=1 Tax=Ferrimonas marina TaxID=299255 RepID=A0A1M5Z5X8_9GAMM|nr:translesion DNA synthesis-associated protein ImuA [Ferrimonas marina]SHI19554.1 cell division inhibitor SulA [Ferrimonas marina]